MVMSRLLLGVVVWMALAGSAVSNDQHTPPQNEGHSNRDGSIHGMLDSRVITPAVSVAVIGAGSTASNPTLGAWVTINVSWACDPVRLKNTSEYSPFILLYYYYYCIHITVVSLS